MREGTEVRPVWPFRRSEMASVGGAYLGGEGCISSGQRWPGLEHVVSSRLCSEVWILFQVPLEVSVWL